MLSTNLQKAASRFVLPRSASILGQVGHRHSVTLKPAVDVTPRAKDRFRKLLERRNLPDGAVQISVREKGCAGLCYGIDFHESRDIKHDGQSLVTIAEDGVTLLVDRKSLGYVIGSEIDWVDGGISAQFVFKNPNATVNCPCGRSFAT